MIAGAVLVADDTYSRPSAFASDVGVSSVYLPILGVFVLAYTVVSPFLSMLGLAVGAAVQGWCLDYKQNCVDQQLEGSTWMMAVREVCCARPLPSPATLAHAPLSAQHGRRTSLALSFHWKCLVMRRLN